MEDSKMQQRQENKTLPKSLINKDRKKQPKTKQESKKKLWITVGIVVGLIATVGIVIGVLAANGVFDADSCPMGQYKVCGLSSDGEKSCFCSDDRNHALKPIIYLYPEEETELTVRLGAPENLTSSYPKYVDGWDVIAYPNGTLIDKATSNKLYSLYWEGVNDSSNFDKTIGFVVKGADSAEFLEEKLETLGLNYKEREEFIVYWLPKLESYHYNYIYFATEEEIENEMPLELSVEPDTMIRIRMVFEGLDEYREVKEQPLTPAPERSGFTVVEWGGIDLNKQ